MVGESEVLLACCCVFVLWVVARLFREDTERRFHRFTNISDPERQFLSRSLRK